MILYWLPWHHHHLCRVADTRTTIHKTNVNKKQKILSGKQKGFRDGLSYSTPQKSEETRGNAITQSRSHPIKKNVEFRDGTQMKVDIQMHV